MSNSVGSPRKSLKEKLVSQNECLIGVMYVRNYFEYGFSGVPLLHQRLFFFFPRNSSSEISRGTFEVKRPTSDYLFLNFYFIFF